MYARTNSRIISALGETFRNLCVRIELANQVNSPVGEGLFDDSQEILHCGKGLD